jgi:hypothetical protein
MRIANVNVTCRSMEQPLLDEPAIVLMTVSPFNEALPLVNTIVAFASSTDPVHFCPATRVALLPSPPASQRGVQESTVVWNVVAEPDVT